MASGADGDRLWQGHTNALLGLARVRAGTRCDRHIRAEACCGRRIRAGTAVVVASGQGPAVVVAGAHLLWSSHQGRDPLWSSLQGSDLLWSSHQGRDCCGRRMRAEARSGRHISKSHATCCGRSGFLCRPFRFQPRQEGAVLAFITIAVAVTVQPASTACASAQQPLLPSAPKGQRATGRLPRQTYHSGGADLAAAAEAGVRALSGVCQIGGHSCITRAAIVGGVSVGKPAGGKQLEGQGEQCAAADLGSVVVVAIEAGGGWFQRANS